MCVTENSNSKVICESLVEKIVKQNEIEFQANQTSLHNQVHPSNIRGRVRHEKEERYRAQLEDLRSRMTFEQIRANDLAQVKGASIWLTALPLAREGYVLHKREFFDALYLRYRWELKYLPRSCACGNVFTVDHALSCLKGGFIHCRHDEIRDLLTVALDEVAYDVTTEPALAPLSGEVLPLSANSADDARVDIAARGFWQRCGKAFFDVRVFNPYALTYRNRSLSSNFKTNEEKKRQYNQRVIEIEHGSFAPLVFSAYGGCGRETEHFLSTLADQIVVERHFNTSVVMSWLRRKIAFALLRSQVMCIRGSRTVFPVICALDIELSENNTRF